MKKIFFLLAAALLAIAPVQAATITIVNMDGAGEGFNDPTPAVPVGGNPGTTIGQQRLNLFQKAAEIWGGLLTSSAEIRVESSFDPLSCTASSAVLGSAGTISVYRDFAGAEFPATWYHSALADKQADVDLDGGANDIRARFNVSIDNNAACLSGTNWYYGFDGNAGSNISLLPVLLHEMAHGLGFSTFVNGSTGTEFLGFEDVYERLLFDNDFGVRWPVLSDGQRAISAINTGKVVWDGPGVTAASHFFLGALPILVANAPGTLPATMAIGTAGFGPQLDETGVTGDLVLADDGTGTTSDACTALVNGAQISGNIALIDRGTCAFVLKAQMAEAAGAIAVIIANNVVAGAPPSLGGTDPGLTIPTVSVTLADGNLLKAAIGSGANVTLHLDPAQLAGADALGRVKIYTPNPLESGSSVSHFDVSATPSLLMEPAITATLNDQVDLTLQHFDDIGWFSPRVSAVGQVPQSRAELGIAFPNPFNPSTRIAFRVAADGPVHLAVHDAAGRLVRTLVSTSMATGEYTVVWDGNDTIGRRAASGVYFYRLEVDGYSDTRKMVMLK
jgi:hypothetical protein